VKARCKCPKCGEEVIEGCEGCIRSGTLFHKCKNKKEPDVFDVEWEIIEE